MTHRLFPSLLSVPYFEHKHIIEYLESTSRVAGLHIDVMDDHFVDNIGFSPQMIIDIAKITKKILWVHLMVDNPENWVSRLCQALKWGDRVTIHLEVMQSNASFLKLVQELRLCKLQVGLALNPDTELSNIIPYIAFIDHILIMTVIPGFGGQDFLDNMFEKIQETTQLAAAHEKEISVGVDGGITVDIYQKLKQMRVKDFAIGKGVFAQKKPYQNMLRLFT